jgi:hypothetical protein
VPPLLLTTTLNWICAELSKHKQPFALAGGMALPFWNYPRGTQDIDLLVVTDDNNHLLELTHKLRCFARRTPAIKELGGVSVLQTTYAPPEMDVTIAIDFLIGSLAFHRSALDRAIEVSAEGSHPSLRVVTCEDLILLKLMSGRIVDLADCSRLIEYNRNLIDFPYLEQQTIELGVVAEFSQVMRE